MQTVKNHTLHKDVVLVRQILRHAIEQELIDQLPLIPKPGPIDANPRPWLEPQEWRHLCHVSRQRVREAEGNPKLQGQRQDLDDLLHFLFNSACRVGEVRALRFRDCRVGTNKDGDKLLLVDVTGKTGSRTTVALAGAAEVFQRRFTAAREDLDALVFPEHKKDAFGTLIEAAGLRKDQFGYLRNLKSLRSTAISARILDQPELNLTLIARNVGTSVVMIDQFYAKRLRAVMHKDALSALRRG